MIEQVSPRDLPGWLQAAADGGLPPLLLDVREPAEWAAASVRADDLGAVPIKALMQAAGLAA